MKNKWYFSLICSVLAAGMMIMPAGAEETEAVTESAAEETAQVWDSSSRLEDGIFTVYIQSFADEKDGYYWTVYTGDKGDATFYDLVTQSTQEEGYAYVGSFMGLEGETADDYIRIVHTNGFAERSPNTQAAATRFRPRIRILIRLFPETGKRRTAAMCSCLSP